MVIAEKVSKSYGAKVALDSLDLQVQAGTVLGFIGPNGAGKTTTMRILAGTMPQSSGRVVIDGFDMAEEPLKAKAITGYLPENAPLYSHTRVKPFLEFAARMRGVPECDLKAAVDLAAARCALESVMDEEMDALSKGFRRRVCLAQAIIHDPKVLLLDEPTDGLDPVQKLQIRSLIKELREGRVIIVSTHILEEVDAVCGHVLAIARGRTLFNGSAAQFKSCGRGAALLIDASSQDQPSAKAVVALQAIPSASSVELLSENGGALKLRVGCNENVEGIAAAEAVSALSAAGFKVDSCSFVAARLDEIFTALVAGASPAAAAGAEEIETK